MPHYSNEHHLTAVKNEVSLSSSIQVKGKAQAWIVHEKVIWLMNRLCIYPKDIQIITGRSDRYGRNLIKKIKEHFNKQQHQVVTIEEFCQYMGLQYEVVSRQLR